MRTRSARRSLICLIETTTTVEVCQNEEFVKEHCLMKIKFHVENLALDVSHIYTHKLKM